MELRAKGVDTASGRTLGSAVRAVISMGARMEATRRGMEALHLRLLRLLRDHGAVSRAELAGELGVPRPRLVAELERLVAAGYVTEAGPAASRGGRRSTLVALAPGLRFAAVDLGATSIDIEVTNGKLEPVAAFS